MMIPCGDLIGQGDQTRYGGIFIDHDFPLETLLACILEDNQYSTASQNEWLKARKLIFLDHKINKEI
jgi:hypothetical protein